MSTTNIYTTRTVLFRLCEFIFLTSKKMSPFNIVPTLYGSILFVLFSKRRHLACPYIECYYVKRPSKNPLSIEKHFDMGIIGLKNAINVLNFTDTSHNFPLFNPQTNKNNDHTLQCLYLQ
jgi:hypothetical protein